MTIMIAIFSIGYRGKTVNFETHSVHYRTTTAHFLNKGKWDETIVENILKEEVRKLIYKETQCTSKPVYLIIDNTIFFKNKAVFKGETSYNRRCLFPLFTSEKEIRLRSSGNSRYVVLQWNYTQLCDIMYNKSVSKIELVCKIASEMPVTPVVSYLLCDS